MKMMGASSSPSFVTLSSSLLLLLLVLLISVIHGKEIACTFQSSKGDFYDFSTLSKCDLSGYSVNDDEGFRLNICNSVEAGCSRADTAVCQAGQFSNGVTDAATFSDIAQGQGAVLTYGGGDSSTCPNNTPRKTIINLICDAGSATPALTFISEQPTCVYTFNLKSKLACPVQKNPQINWCKVNVFLVPHTHDDVGWQVTVDQYYNDNVRNIISSVTESLAANPARKFVYVEQAFFTRWWYDPKINDTQRNSLRKSYTNNQLEFVIGGWTMQDDACTTYGSDIEQMTLGHQFLWNTFGARPSKGWQLDPFGAGTMTGTLQKLAGFDAHVIDRVSNKNHYASTQTLQFLWQGVPSLGTEGEIFTEILDGNPNAYCDWLFAFNFDNNPVNSGNVATYAATFYKMVNARIPHFKTNNILAPWGCDFAFQHATNNFASMDVLMAYLAKNADSTGVTVKYSTVSDYFAAVKASSGGIQWPTNVGGDFFDYDDGGVWSGYFTSRTALKGVVRQGEAAAHAAEQIYSIGRKLATIDTKGGYSKLYTLRDANGESTHHDGVTGTSEPPVVQMYVNDLNNGITSALGAGETILGTLISTRAPKLDHTLGDLLNLKVGQTVGIVLYNSLGWARQSVVTLPLNIGGVNVTDAAKAVVTSQVSTAWLTSAKGKYNLYFEASVPPLGFSTYFVTGVSMQADLPQSYVVNGQIAPTVIKNNFLELEISSDTGRISSFTSLANKVQINLDQEFAQYRSADPSGAYVFKVSGPATSVSGGNPPKTTVFTGKVVTEVHQAYVSYVTQVIKVYNSASADASAFVELSAQIGVLPDHVEVVSHFATNVNNGVTFFTDDNGFQYIQRTNTYPNAGVEFQHYPSIYSSYIKDDARNAQFTVVTDRSHSASSLASGQFEVMVHRNPSSQDNKGLQGPWQEHDVVYPTQRLVLDTIQASKLPAIRQPYLLNFPLIPFSSTGLGDASFKSKFQFVSAALPDNVHIQAVNALENNSSRVIFRLVHLFAVNEHAEYSKPATVDVSKLFANVVINKFDEVTLTANRVTVPNAPQQVTLTPKQIRSFIIDFK